MRASSGLHGRALVAPITSSLAEAKSPALRLA
jgi:hypothetical protein